MIEEAAYRPLLKTAKLPLTGKAGPALFIMKGLPSFIVSYELFSDF